MGKAYLKIPGHFCFVEQVRRDEDPEDERQRLQAMAKLAIDKYFNFNLPESEARKTFRKIEEMLEDGKKWGTS